MTQPTGSWRRRLMLASVAAVGAVLLVVLGLLVVDVYLHYRHQEAGGYNVWGYRGPTRLPKQPGEVRVVVLGGSTALGYGVNWDESFPYYLERELNTRGAGRFTVISLAYNNEGAYAFRYTLEDYAYLDYDLAILYEGYNDLDDAPNDHVFRRESPVFRSTGYMPILPMILREKAWMILYEGDLDRAYRGERTVFRPTLAGRATAAALQAGAETTEALERQIGRLTRDVSDERLVASGTGCGDRWQHYCGAVHEAIAWARANGARVVMGTQPYISDRHIDQQRALLGMIENRFGSHPDVVHVNLGPVIDLRDRDLAFDGMHLTPAGNAIVASQFVEPVLELSHR